jgi:hypothetical protein
MVDITGITVGYGDIITIPFIVITTEIIGDIMDTDTLIITIDPTILTVPT